LKRKVFSVLLTLVMLLTLSLVTAVPVAAAEIPGSISFIGDVEATMTRTDTLDAITFDVEILSENAPHGVYGVGLVFATSTDQPAFQVWYAEAGVAQGAPDIGWWYWDYGTGWGSETMVEVASSGTGITATGDGASGEKVFTVTIPTEVLGGFGATYYYAVQVRTNLIGWYPAAYDWSADVSAFAEVSLLVLNEDTGMLYGTIQSAINAATPDDTIIVADGTYPEDITINKPLTIVSSGEGTYPIIDGQSEGYQGAVNIAANDVTFGGDGVGFVVWGAGQAAVYFTQPVSGCVVEDNEIVAAPGKNALLTGGGQSNHVIRGNHFTGNPASQLVYVNGETSVGVASVSVDFIDNTFAGNAPTGPALGQEAADSIISGNTFATVTGYASLELWVDGTVTGNDFTGDLTAGGVYVLDNTGFGPGIPGGGDYVLDIDAVLSNNNFLRAVVVDHEGASLLPKIWANIQDGVNAAVAGDTVNVLAGTYKENVAIPGGTDDLQLVGTGSGETTIEPATGCPITLFGWAGPISNISIRGFTLETADASHALLAGSGTPDGTYYTTNLELEDIVVDGGQRGVGLNAVNGVTLSDVHLSNVTGSPEAALELTGAFNLTFTQGSIEDNDLGVKLQPGVGSYGNYGANGNIQIHLTNFCGNGIAIENQDSGTEIDATNNYWCHAL